MDTPDSLDQLVLRDLKDRKERRENLEITQTMTLQEEHLLDPEEDQLTPNLREGTVMLK
jgi:hypothetical protein